VTPPRVSSGRDFAPARSKGANVRPTQTALRKAKQAEREGLKAMGVWFPPASSKQAPPPFDGEQTRLGVPNLSGAVRAHFRNEVADQRREIAGRTNRLPLELTHEDTVKQSRAEAAASAGWAFRAVKRTRAPELDKDEQ
jgi:hypothetical protein